MSAWLSICRKGGGGGEGGRERERERERERRGGERGREGILFVFCLNSFLFLSKFSISVSSILFSIVDFCVLVLYGVHSFFQDCVHFLYRWFFVFQSVKSVF